ncbi:AAA family ATPase [Paraburkholderia youngii]|uniref:AAA family ATPase n=1 Tax=Paraburkholderia youngii TaxID=2782701 RepID=UPI003D257E5E
MSEIDRARDALHAIDAGLPRADWIKVGMAAKAAGLDADDFIEWSRTGANYTTDRAAKIAWDSFAPGGPITGNTLFGMAREAGWPEPVNGNSYAPKPARAKPQETTDPSALWDAGKAAATHPYVIAKRIPPDGVRIDARDPNTLYVPLRDLDGVLVSLQRVRPGGAKLNLKGVTLGRACCYQVGDVTGDCTLYVCEGAATAHAVARADYHAAVVATAGMMRYEVVGRAFRERAPKRRIVLVADRGTEAETAKVAHALRAAWVGMPEASRKGYDALDLESEHGTDALTTHLTLTHEYEPRYRVLSANEIVALPTPDDLIDDVVPMNSLGSIWGGVGVAKSFVLIDMAACLAEGTPFFGHDVLHPVPVTVLSLEGQSGLPRRLAAWRKAHGDRPLPPDLHFITQRFNLLQPGDVDDLCEAVELVGGYGGALFVDTLSRATVGSDENSAVDMGLIVDTLFTLRERIGGSVIPVHHTGKNADMGMRGHSNMTGALDWHMQLTGDKDTGLRHWGTSKEKDAPDDLRHAFRLRQVQVGTKPSGKPLLSCYVQRADDEVAADSPPRAPVVRVPMGSNQKIVYRTLKPMFIASKFIGVGDGCPKTYPCIPMKSAIDAVAKKLDPGSGRQAEVARRTILSMQFDWYGQDGEWLWNVQP